MLDCFVDTRYYTVNKCYILVLCISLINTEMNVIRIIIIFHLQKSHMNIKFSVITKIVSQNITKLSNTMIHCLLRVRKYLEGKCGNLAACLSKNLVAYQEDVPSNFIANRKYPGACLCRCKSKK